MRNIFRSGRYRKDERRQASRRKDIQQLIETVQFLVDYGELPPSFHPHPLRGKWNGLFECHIEPDWLLLYRVSDTEVRLYRTGTHADLFE